MTKEVEELLELEYTENRNKCPNDPEEKKMNLINILSNYSYIMSKSSTSYIQLTNALLSCI